MPTGAFPGHTFFVQVPVNETAATNVAGVSSSSLLELWSTSNGNIPIVNAVEVSNDLALTVEQEYVVASDFVLVCIPEGSAPGTKIQLQLPDGRLIETLLVPSDPSIKAFYHQVSSSSVAYTV